MLQRQYRYRMLIFISQRYQMLLMPNFQLLYMMLLLRAEMIFCLIETVETDLRCPKAFGAENRTAVSHSLLETIANTQASQNL